MVSVKRDGVDVGLAGVRGGAKASGKKAKTALEDAGVVEGREGGGAPAGPTSKMVVRTVLRESHNRVIRKVAYNRTGAPFSREADPLESSANLFATVGGNQCTVYDGRHFGEYMGLVVHYVHQGEDGGAGAELTSCAWTDARGQTNHPRGDDHVVVGTSDGEILVISVVEAAVTRKLVGHKREVFQLATSASCPGRLLSLSRDGTVKLWSTYEERCLCTYKVGAQTSSIAWSPDGAWFLTGSAGGVLYRWFVGPHGGDEERVVEKKAAGSFEKLAVEGVDHKDQVDSVTFVGGDGGLRAMTKSVDGRIFLWQAPGAEDPADGGSRIKAWRVPGSVKCYSDLDVTGDGMYFTVGNSSGQVLVFETGESDCVAKLEPHRVREQVTSCAVSDDHEDVIATLGDGYLFRYRHLPEGLLAQKEEQEKQQEKQEEEEEEEG
ncbi:WD repeat domain-containing protein [Chloropicon primus]|uniref:Uncharacterized protein n=1 Tax=Chloropicon primus TaxID=1764295 RepID=A0A5B8MJR1_9CHLO|nr:hypothetical protein A3770_04p30390 [Chloropicon primus]UPQ99731.1 WD repeat domain-containing protein [Chloropicon primus]|mmetsp:Transcript_13451/g.37790  ORF Transcript_13451/g.37790 Transcript_13451/m.37790 type:complete len:435 (-) Transcript_13451:58-1362(-)|eukprot:QDZ20521.1 hypothetical protein A3770_04p30390 [Chloropicon primus]